MTEISTNTNYTVKSGDTLWAISKRTGVSVSKLQEANPNIDPNNIKIGEKLALGEVSEKSPQKTETQKEFPQVAKPASTSTSGIMTIEKYESSQPKEIKEFKKSVKKDEGNVPNTYIAPEGKATIGQGHQLINKPEFLKDIEEQKLTPKAKNKKLKEALKNPQNTEKLKVSLQKDLEDAIKITGIKNVPSTINKDLKLTDAQINLLLNSDIKKAQNAMEKTIGKENLAKRTSNEKQVALDLFYNVGSALETKAPSFVKAFKEGDMNKAQEELDIFKANGKIQLGLIKRNYTRMKLINENLTPAAEQKLLTAVNKDRQNKGLPTVKTFAEAEKILKA